MTEIEFLDHLKYVVERILGYNSVCAYRVQKELIDNDSILDYGGTPIELTLEQIVELFKFGNGFVKSIIKQIDKRLEELRNA